MARADFNDILAFMAVAREGSFTRAAGKLGLSQSTLSHTIRDLEERLGVRLLTRTTRKVSTTEAGQRLVDNVGPRLEEVQLELASVRELREKPSGTIRLTATEFATNTILLPKIGPLLKKYPDINVEIIVDFGLTDIVAQRFDAGVRSGEQVAKDMVAVRIGPDLRMAVVGSPLYFRGRAEPKKPQDLVDHNCINLRLQTRGNVYAWEFEKDGRVLNVRVNGQLTFNASTQMVNAALAGHGLAFVPDEIVAAYIKSKRLKRVLADWCPLYSGYHLYYPSRRQHTQAFSLLIAALRYKKGR
jgi:DNA-binding transcriptional LysR family regulator